MQGLADGYFVIPYTLGDYLVNASLSKVSTDDAAFKESSADVQTKITKLLSGKGSRTVTDFHRALGKIMWDKVGMGRTEAGLTEGINQIRSLREEFWQNLRVPGEQSNINQNLEYAGRVADFLEFGELLARDALERRESCGGHFREEYQTPEGEAQRDDENFSYVAAWEYSGDGKTPVLHKEQLVFEEVHPSQRSYK
jgi:succinate dehydrogenase / fumarate reductase flavoprotein subunit